MPGGPHPWYNRPDKDKEAEVALADRGYHFYAWHPDRDYVLDLGVSRHDGVAPQMRKYWETEVEELATAFAGSGCLLWVVNERTGKMKYQKWLLPEPEPTEEGQE